MRYLKAGIITLMFLLTHSAMAEMNQNSVTKDKTIKGTIVELDRETGAGVLRKNRTNDLVPFRFAKNIRDKNIATLRAGHVVEFTYSRNQGNVAARK